MIRLRTSQVELTPSDVAYTIRRIALQRRAVQAAESAATLALQNARKSPDKHSLRLPLGRDSYSRDGSIISEEPVVCGHREFWDKVVVEAGPIGDADIGNGDGETTPTSYTQDRSALTDHSSILPYELHREGNPQRDAYCEAMDRDSDRDKSQADGDDILLRIGVHAFNQFDGACDGTSGGSEFCSPSISVSSFTCLQRGMERMGGSEEEGESYPSSSEFEEDVLSEPNLPPRVSTFGDSGLAQFSQYVSPEEEANLLTLRHSFSALLNFGGAPESPPGNPSPSKSSFLSSPSVHISDSLLSTHSSESVDAQTHLHGSPRHSPARTLLRSISRSRESAMGLPVWNGSDYEDRKPRYARRYRPRTSTYSFEESESSSRTGHNTASEIVQRLSERAQASMHEEAPELSDEETVEDDDRYPSFGELVFGGAWSLILNSFNSQPIEHESAVVSAGGPVQLPGINAVFSMQGGVNPSHHRPDRSPIRYPQVHMSPVMVAPPPSPSQGSANGIGTLPGQVLAAPRVTIFNGSQMSTHPRRRPLRPGQRIPRLLRSTEILGREMLEREDTPRERRGRELGLPDHWIRDNVMAQREFHHWVNLSGVPGLGRGDSSEEL
ncbi:MAG: hypothetical protein M1839_002065 [Geoglossum umbratile]|nr:MAG: hypothetical protein M1839_002065 [Geoglossum umbratile]